MLKSRFKIQKMDCPSEEQLIRMKLSVINSIEHLDFDIPGRTLTVLHHGSDQELLETLQPLNFDCTLLSTESAVKEDLTGKSPAGSEKKLLWQVLIINFFFFILEALTGWWANSLGLVSDSLDMLADSLVYALALFAAGGPVFRKKQIAKIAGILQLLLALIGFLEVVKRFLGIEPVPAFQTMILVSILALIGNSVCLFLLQKSKSKEAHMQASLIFTSNDVIINLGVILAGALVFITKSNYPDLLIGGIIFYLVGKGAIKILKL